MRFIFFFFNDTATTEIYTLSLHDALPIYAAKARIARVAITEVERQLLHQRLFPEHRYQQLAEDFPDVRVAPAGEHRPVGEAVPDDHAGVGDVVEAVAAIVRSEREAQVAVG